MNKAEWESTKKEAWKNILKVVKENTEKVRPGEWTSLFEPPAHTIPALMRAEERGLVKVVPMKGVYIYRVVGMVYVLEVTSTPWGSVEVRCMVL